MGIVVYILDEILLGVHVGKLKQHVCLKIIKKYKNNHL
jgi:hypothetical protein